MLGRKGGSLSRGLGVRPRVSEPRFAGPAYGLPSAICAHQNHYFWGPPKVEPENLIWLQWSRRGVEDHCRSVEKAGEHFHPWGMAEENRPIYMCRGLRHTIAEYWTPDFKHWN